MIELPIKPLTTNRLWKGRRFKTAEYKQYEAVMVALLNRAGLEIPDGKCVFEVVAGVTNRYDLDNAIKSTLDVIQLYDPHFNDRDVFKIVAEKYLTPARNNFLAINFDEYKETDSLWLKQTKLTNT